MHSSYIKSVKTQFEYYKSLGDKTFAQLSDEQLFWQQNESTNSIAIIVQHLYGNMLSRWTDFLTTDGEKAWRNRDEEFELFIKSKTDLLEKWEEGWQCFFTALNSLTPENLSNTIYIRNEAHSIIEAVNRQLAHYPYHIGQIVFIGKILLDENWNSLSIPKGKSTIYNNEKFSNPKL
jgi:hypothetical protein